MLKQFKPLPGTIPTLIYDAYGNSILVYAPKGDTVTPRNIEIGIWAAQTGLSVQQVRNQMLKEDQPMTFTSH